MVKLIIHATISLFLAIGFWNQSFDPRAWLRTEIQEKIQNPKPQYSKLARSLTGKKLPWD